MSPTDASQPDYPAEVQRYGTAGIAAYDNAVQALVAAGRPLADARADVLANWHLFCLLYHLLPPRSI